MKKTLWITVLVVAAAGTLGGGSYYWWLITPPPMPQTPDEVAALLTSRRFTRLSDERKLAYVSQMRRLAQTVDGDERRRLREMYGDDPAVRAAMRDIGELFIVDLARRYAEAPPMQRQLMLDTIIGKMEQDRARRGSDGPPTEEELAQRERRRNEALGHLNEMATRGNLQHAAYMGSAFRDLQQRRRQLGLPEWKPGDE